MDVVHSSTTIISSMDTIHPLTSSHPSTNAPHSSIDDANVLLGLIEWSERLVSNHTKGEKESERLPISFGEAKGELESFTLLGEGKQSEGDVRF